MTNEIIHDYYDIFPLLFDDTKCSILHIECRTQYCKITPDQYIPSYYFLDLLVVFEDQKNKVVVITFNKDGIILNWRAPASITQAITIHNHKSFCNDFNKLIGLVEDLTKYPIEEFTDGKMQYFTEQDIKDAAEDFGLSVMDKVTRNIIREIGKQIDADIVRDILALANTTITTTPNLALTPLSTAIANATHLR